MRTPRNEPVSSDIADAATERTCILTGGKAARDELVRLAVSPPGPDGVCMLLPDALARAPGRGAWLGVCRADLEIAIAKGKLKGALARSFKGLKIAVPDDLPQKITDALTRAFADRLGLEMRAGRLLTGSDRIAENARAGRVAWLAHAADAGTDGVGKLAQAWRVGREAEGSGLAGVTLPLDRAALSVALGRDNVVHLALTDAAAAARLAPLLERLLHYLGRDAAAGNVASGETGHDGALASPVGGAESLTAPPATGGAETTY